MIILPPSRAARRYFAANIDVPKSRRQRLLNRFRRLHVPAPPSPDDPLTALLFTALNSRAIAGSSLADLHCVLLHDEDADGRRRALAFLFHGDAASPFALVKAQMDARNGSLIREATALSEVRQILPPHLRVTVPEVLAVESSERGEVLVITGVSGRSAYFEMQAALLPALRVESHFAAAAEWLSGFHEASRSDEETTAAHGDYWPHNVLADGTSVSVVDWEHFSPAASRFIDLFHYPLTYGISYPTVLYRRRPPEEAFVHTFLRANGVSRAVRTYLHRYATTTGVPQPRIAAAFREFLATRGTMADGTPPHPGIRDLPWARFAKAFDQATDSVFS